jgi:hypothetical protein
MPSTILLLEEVEEEKMTTTMMMMMMIIIIIIINLNFFVLQLQNNLLYEAEFGNLLAAGRTERILLPVGTDSCD